MSKISEGIPTEHVDVLMAERRQSGYQVLGSVVLTRAYRLGLRLAASKIKDLRLVKGGSSA